MKFSVDSKIFQEFPSVKLGVVVGLGIDNYKSSKEITTLLNEWQRKRGQEFASIDIASHDSVKSWREAYSRFGSKPSKYNSSIESLLKRVAKGGTLPQINPLVDLYNALSLRHLLPFGAEDLDKVRGDVRLVFTEGTEKGKYIGSDNIEACEKGEVAYVDDLGFICRRWNWREGDRTKIEKDTSNFILVIEALPPVSTETLTQALQDFVELSKKYLSGEYTSAVIDSNNLTYEVGFHTGSKISEVDGSALKSSKHPSTRIKKPSVDGFDSKPQETKREYVGVAKQIYDTLAKIASVEDVVLEVPVQAEHGDYSSNIALVAAKSQGKKPHELAEEIVGKLQKDKKLSEIVDKIEVAGPGFINFWIKKDVLLDILRDIRSYKDTSIVSDLEKGKKIVVEYTDPNPFKEFHIGHLISNVTGETLCRLQEGIGATVSRVDYFGDVGIHAAKAIWGIQKKMHDEKVTLEDLKKKDLAERVNFMGQGYALGARSFDDPEANKQIARLNTVLYIAAQRMWKEEGKEPIINYDPEGKIPEAEVDAVFELYKTGRQWSLDYFETIYARLGTKFDGYYPESVVGEIGYKLVSDNIGEGKAFEKSEAAVIFRGEKFGLHTRVFINKHNLPTYEAKELGLAPAKYEDFKYDKSIIVVGKELKEYFPVLIRALTEINPKLGSVTRAIFTGMVRLPEGKMSSRTGNVVTVNSLLDRIKKAASKKMATSGYSESEKEVILEKVAVGALKYAFLKNSIGQDVVFDINQALSLEGNSGPYLQYTFTRTQSVLKKAGGERGGKKSEVGSGNLDIEALRDMELNAEELAIMRTFVHFHGIIITAAKNYSPNLLANYLYDLAQKYNTFYNMHRIVDASAKDNAQSAKVQEFRIALTQATGQILKHGLKLLGIEAPEKM